MEITTPHDKIPNSSAAGFFIQPGAEKKRFLVFFLMGLLFSFALCEIADGRYAAPVQAEGEKGAAGGRGMLTQDLPDDATGADALWTEGVKYYNDKKYLEAYQKFRESLRLKLAPERKEYFQRFVDWLNDNVRRLRNEGEALQKKGNLHEAVDKYRESLNYSPDPSLEKHIASMESALSEARKKGDALWEECKALCVKLDMNAAFEKCKEGVKLSPESSRKQFVRYLADENALARRLRDEGKELQQQGKLKEASLKYYESLLHWPDKKLEEHMKTVETRLLQGPGKLRYSGVWEQVDGKCRGSRYT
ncbi:MAG TPA: hypothetical protein VN328_13580, partial [Thermodesulfovibrionales bacterium]|nr:hypothetical protein [Thermodesulfovibrionales bacterium]